jgi:hypothetical protein
MFNPVVVKLKIINPIFVRGLNTVHEKGKCHIHESPQACLMPLFPTLQNLNHLKLKLIIK